MSTEQENMKQPIKKWEATVTTTLANASADQIWPLLKDFFGIYKYFPSLSTSYGVQGNNGEIGSIRYCEGSQIPAQQTNGGNGESNDGDGSNGKKLQLLLLPPPAAADDLISWSMEKIVAVDPAKRSLRYEIVDSNIGFNSYVSTIRVLRRRMNDDHPAGKSSGGGGDEPGCVVEWSFSVDPVKGLELEDLAKKYQLGLQVMAHKMEDAILKN